MKLTDKNGWNPIRTAPQDQTAVIIYSTELGILYQYALNKYGRNNHFYEPLESGYSVVRDATHWRPMLNPPLDKP